MGNVLKSVSKDLHGHCYLSDAWIHFSNNKKRRVYQAVEQSGYQDGPKRVFQSKIMHAYGRGMFICMFAEYLSRGVFPSFQQNDMPSLRRQIYQQLMKVCFLL
ncbi:hypothetical protein P5673_002351 [Acropora cervicornis]|uniref:Uncharacterized protein n=1 Tax=Acropora cervicornis TaxID=6130 RepID=A0AAD9R2Y0_ACRCE|nr:hypothetical protein P5673_002351 [Acropora cervicornis]